MLSIGKTICECTENYTKNNTQRTMTNYTIPFGNGHLDFQVPPHWHVNVAASNPMFPPLSTSIIDQRLKDFAALLVNWHDPSRPLIFVFTDATRASPDQQLLEPIVRYLQPANLDILFICAIGMHRPSTEAEKRAKLGDWIVDNFLVVDHDPTDVIDYGTLSGVPIEANSRLEGATVVGVGVVEPHQYAGYSGGAKTVVIGCGGPRTIGATHGPLFLDLPGTRLGRIEGNPFQAFIRQAGQRIGQQLAVNVVLDSVGNIMELACGKAGEVHDQLVAYARRIYETPVPNVGYDVVIAGVGSPKDVNLYQASRAATYIGLNSQPVIRRGGVIIVPAPIPEGGGDGQGEKNFMQMLLRFGPTGELISYLRENGCRPGDQRAYMIAQLRQQYRLILTGATHVMPVIEAGLDNADNMGEALYMAQKLSRSDKPRLLIVPHALQTIPVPANNSDELPVLRIEPVS